MAITASDLIWRQSALISDSDPTANGGTPNYNNTILNGVKNNIFPDVSQSQRLAGLTSVRKAFLAINLNAEVELLNARICLGAETPADDFVVISKGTNTDKQNAMPTKYYGVGSVATAYSSGTSLVITPENYDWYDAHGVFAAGDLIRVSNGTTIDYVAITAAAYGTSNITLTLASALPNAYGIGSKVAGVIEQASVKATFTTPVVTSTAGSFTSAGKVILYARGADTQTYTLTFTSATSYTITGSVEGSYGSFSTGSDATVNRLGTSNPAIIIKSTAFSGTFAVGDTITITSSPAVVPVWVTRIVNPNTGNIANDNFSLVVSGESY